MTKKCHGLKNGDVGQGRSPALLRQCSRLVAANQQQQRGNSDIAFTFASTSDVYYANAKVNQIDVPGTTSAFGICPNHVPTLAVMTPGIVTVFETDGTQKKFFVSSGSVTVNPDASVQVLAEEAHPLERIDKEAVREGLQKAQSEVSAASSEQAKAEAQIALECYESLQKALD